MLGFFTSAPLLNNHALSQSALTAEAGRFDDVAASWKAQETKDCFFPMVTGERPIENVAGRRP